MWRTLWTNRRSLSFRQTPPLWPHARLCVISSPARNPPASSARGRDSARRHIDRWLIHLVGCISTTSIPTVLGADAEGCSLASGQGSHNVWNRQEALRLQRQVAAAEKAAERERKLQETAAGKAHAEQLNADLGARIARLESILRRGLDREAAIDLNAMLRNDEFPPLDLGTDGVAAPRPIWSAPPEPGPIAGFFGAKSRHEQRLAGAREKFERAELEYVRVEVARHERIREHTSRYEAALLAYQNDIARHNSRIARGLEGWTTERSGDDGVDAVVINRDPMVGGLTIVQAKRYTNVIGVSHIRELVGAMDEKRAGRGILVTTSWFASGCKIKARENGRIQLIEGSELVHLVKEHLHKDVLVAPPAARSRARHQ
jgi:hypothetical protein